MQRGHDKNLIQVAKDTKTFAESELVFIDRCRKCSQALTIADMASSCGEHFDSAKSQGQSMPHSSTTKLHHVDQEKPPPRQWIPWQKCASC